MCKIRKTYRIFKRDAQALDRLFQNPSKVVRLLISAYIRKNSLPSSEQAVELVRLRTEAHRIGVNINQIARRLNMNEAEVQADLKTQANELKALISDIRKCLGGFDGA